MDKIQLLVELEMANKRIAALKAELKPWQRMVEQIEELWDKGLNSEGADFNENGWFFGFYGYDKVGGRWTGGRGQGASLPEAVDGAYRQVKEGGLG